MNAPRLWINSTSQKSARARSFLAWCTCCWLGLTGLTDLAQAEPAPAVNLVADLLEAFDPGQVRDSASCEIRRPSSAGGVKQNALFEHPQTPAKPARVSYALQLPPVQPGEVLLLAFDIALADGTKLTPVDDGVQFGVEVEGERVFSGKSRENVWRSHALDLTAYAGRRVTLALLTEALANTSYDWAVWGNPRVLQFRGPAQPGSTETGRLSSPSPVGVLAFERKSGSAFRVRIKPQGGGAPIEWTEPELDHAAAAAWVARDFSFPLAAGVEIEWEPKEALASQRLLVAGYPARPRVTALSPSRALITAGDPVTLRVAVRNEGRGKLGEGEARLELRAGGEAFPARALPALAPNDTWQGEWAWTAPASQGSYVLQSRLWQGTVREEKLRAMDVFGPASKVAGASLQNDFLKLELVRDEGAYVGARLFSRQGDQWKPAAVWKPLFRIISETRGGDKDWEIRPRDLRRLQAGQSEILELAGSGRDGDGVVWQVKLRVTLEADRPNATVHYEWSTLQARRIKFLGGPNVYVGDAASGEAKSWGLFPGLEYLFGPEPSSNPRDFAAPLHDRRTPHPDKVTVPLMAVTVDENSQVAPERPARFFAPDSLKDRRESAPDRPAFSQPLSGSGVTVALSWDPLQRWDGEHAFPSARFASPNFDEGMRNHRLGLFLPSVPEFVAENGDRAVTPYPLAAGRVLTLDARLTIAPGAVQVALRQWLDAVGGLPKPNPRPRTFQEELDLCRTGFLKTLWDEPSQKWRHCIGWAGSQAPGFAALLWLDAKLAESPEARQQSAERVELAAKNMLREGGPGLLTSQANCHIMQWEFPFLYGYLPEALAGLEGLVGHLIATQQPSGAWLYDAGNAEQADLGQGGDSVLGTCANRAATLLRYARITGDRPAWQAGEKALQFMESFRVPRGGQTWECPIYEPDILAAAYAIRAYHDAYRVTGDRRWLHDAVYWAETGVPFIYLWSLPERPMMLGATIPVFGSTFYTHTWLAVPVQWCGLVYSYHVLHLAQELEKTGLRSSGSPLPLALNFSPADWKRIVELITVSGLYQQFADGERAGSYPDSISRFEQRNGAFINPEDILLNVLALEGHDPDVQTSRLRRTGGEVVVSSGAAIQELQWLESAVRFRLNFFPQTTSQTLVTGVKPREVRVDGQVLARAAKPLEREPGWWWDEKRGRLFVAAPHPTRSVEVRILE